MQTTRLVFNNPEEWLVDDSDEIKKDILTSLNGLLDKYNIGFCSLGRLPTRLSHLGPQIVFSGNKFNCSVDIQRADVTGALKVAKACEEIASKTEGGLGNFRFCVSLNFANDSFCPFFPGSFAPSSSSSSVDDDDSNNNGKWSLSDKQMQNIATEMNIAETSFITFHERTLTNVWVKMDDSDC